LTTIAFVVILVHAKQTHEDQRISGWQQQLWFERTVEDVPEIRELSLMLSMEVGIYPRLNFFENLWRRITIAAKVLFTGYHTATGEVILDEDGIKALQFALKQGLASAKAR